MSSAVPNPGTLVISLDFELYWGVRDVIALEAYAANLRGVRQAIPALLQLFRDYGVHATWATVGFLFFDRRDELSRSLPDKLPSYRQRALSPYEALREIGENEQADPYHFAASLLRMIAAAPGQEIATHTFSHFYCMEEGQSRTEFEADLRAAAKAAALHGQTLRSIVFPRNQINESYLASCAGVGLLAYRGNPPASFWRGGALSREPVWRRAARLLDSYLPLAEDNCFRDSELGDVPPFNVRASRFLRPYSPRLRALEPLRLRRVLDELTHAGRNGEIYHLWWHPHNFGVHLEENIEFLRRILDRFAELRASHGMESRSMAEVAELRLARVGLTSAVGSGV